MVATLPLVCSVVGSRGPSPSFARVSPTMDQGVQVSSGQGNQRRTGNLSPQPLQCTSTHSHLYLILLAVLLLLLLDSLNAK